MKRVLCVIMAFIACILLNISVFATDEKEISGISVCTGPDKTEYSFGETVDATGLTLYVFYSDGTCEVKSDGYTLTDTLINQLGNRPVTVNYKGFSTVFYVKGYYKTYQKVLSVVSFLVSFFSVSFRNILAWF